MNKNTAHTIVLSIFLLGSIIISGIFMPSFAMYAGCITSKCHAEIDKGKYVHGPIVVGECLLCHGESPKHSKKPEQYSFKSIKNVAKACYICHEDSHTPIEKNSDIKNSNCIICHDPHGSESPSLLAE